MRDMKTISLGKKSRNKFLHIEVPGGIVNIQVGLTDRNGRSVTSVEIIANGNRYSGDPEWWLPDFPEQPNGFNARLVQAPLPTKT